MIDYFDENDSEGEGEAVDAEPKPESACPAHPACPAARPATRPLALNSLDLLAEIDTRELPQLPEPGSGHDSRAANPASAPAPPHPTVPGLFARRSINLVIGSSTAGKTPLILSQLESYLTAADHSFLGYPLPAGQPPDQCAALVCSGTLDSLYARIAAMELEALADPVLFPIRDWEPTSGETALDTLNRLYSQLCRAARQPVRFLLIDGLQLMLEGTGKVNDPRAVRDFYRLLNQFCLNHDCTILGTVGMAKMRKGECYPLLADRVYGSTMWSQEADTLIGIEQTSLHLDVSQRPSYRKITVNPKFRNGQNLWVDFDEHGRLELVDLKIEDAENTFYAKLDAILEKAPSASQWTRDQFNTIGDSIGASGRTLERWISSRCHESLGMLERHGGTRNRTYHKPQVN
jgi:hypothetical protein